MSEGNNILRADVTLSPPAAVVLDDPQAVINALTAQVRSLQHRLNVELERRFAEAPDIAREMLRCLRAYQIIPVHIGSTSGAEVLAHIEKRNTISNPSSVLYFLEGAPLSDAVKESVRKAAANGDNRWYATA